MPIQGFLIAVLLLIGGVATGQAKHGLPNHNTTWSFTHDARPTWYTNTDTVAHSNAGGYILKDTFGCEINPAYRIAGFQMDVTEIVQDTSGGHVITGRLVIEACATRTGSYTTLYTKSFNMYTIGQKQTFNYDVDCKSAKNIIGGPNKYRWYRVTLENVPTDWGYFSWNVSLLYH